MLESGQPTISPERVRTLQIIVVALALGVLIFLGVVLFMPTDLGRQTSDEGRMPIVTYVALAYGVAALLVGPLLGTIIVTTGRRKLAAAAPQTGRGPSNADLSERAPSPSHTDKLIQVYMAKTIVSAAVYEGAGLLLCIAYMLDHNTPSAILAAILAAGILLQMPTQDRAQRWLERQHRQLEHDRQMRA